ncbi:MAG: hypothetical protein LC118_18765 [Dehalococcoidia bacterium]|nr:hypothetical protein [Dehalococcoidia bacterium]
MRQPPPQLHLGQCLLFSQRRWPEPGEHAQHGCHHCPLFRFELGGRRKPLDNPPASLAQVARHNGSRQISHTGRLLLPTGLCLAHPPVPRVRAPCRLE